MRTIHLQPPEVLADRIRLRWSVEPVSALYRNTACEWVFPAEVDPRRLPPGLIAVAMLLCLHPHWTVLQPCRIRLPFSLAPEEQEFWRRLMRTQWETLEAYRQPDRATTPFQVEWENPEPAHFHPVIPVPPGARCATAFSGGKDSLLQAGVLSEITERPLLVAVTSPMPGLMDHQHPKRRRVLDEVEGRCSAQRVEIRSDFRACWENLHPFKLGYAVSVMLLTAHALGASHLFLASENELQENQRDGDRLIQHPHAMYSGVALGAVRALLEPWGFTCSSLTFPLHSGQVQTLLWRRYPRLRDLQFSCWEVGAEAAMCNRCPQCLRIALCAAAAGYDPAEMGADLAGLLIAQNRWAPKSFLPLREGAPPKMRVSARLGAQVFDYVRRLSPARIWALTRGRAPVGRRVLALAAFGRLKRLAAAYPQPGWTGYAAPWLEAVDPLVRQPLRLIIETVFAPETGSAGRASRLRAQERAAWIAAPLAGRAIPAAGWEGESTPAGVEPVEWGGILLGLIVRSTFRQEGIRFFTPPTFSQQLAYMNRPAGYRIRPHVHLPVARALVGTQEALWVKSGRVRIDFYDAARVLRTQRVLEAGDLVLLTGGGHGFEMLTDCEMMEVKQGPFTPAADKMPIDREGGPPDAHR